MQSFLFVCVGRARVLVCLLLMFSKPLFTPSFVSLKKIMTYISYKSLRSLGRGAHLVPSLLLVVVPLGSRIRSTRSLRSARYPCSNQILR